MKKRRILAMFLASFLLLGCLPGCQNKKKSSNSLPYSINEMDVALIDDLPDWSGDALDLTVWYAQGTNDLAIGKSKTNDKFQEEIKRVSGISLSEKTSFDNGGESADSKIAKMVSSKSWPHVSVSLENSILQTLAEKDKLYDLTDLIPKYMPNYMAYINSNEELRKAYDEETQYNGRKYVWQGLSTAAFRYTDPEYSDEKYEAVNPIKNSRGSFWIRDDILKKIHPEAYSLKEQQEIYLKNGSFTKEEITDFTVKSVDEFRQLLEEIAALNVTENGKKVWPFYTFDGMDNWSLFAMFNCLVGAGNYAHNSYFVYYDSQEQKLMNSAKSDWFKEFARFCNELYRDGLASEEALIDNKAAFDQKKNNGEYAILYGMATPPSEEVLRAGGKNYSYRKVYIDVPLDETRFLDVNTESLWEERPLSFFKDMLTETEVEQILRFIDFTYTDAGMKFAQWGPKKSGLYQENEDGTLIFTDKDFEKALLFDGDDQVLFDYGYESFPGITSFIGGTLTRFNKYNAKLMYANYDRERVASEYGDAFNFGYVDPLPDFPRAKKTWDIWNFTGEVDGAMQMWSARQTVEDAVKQLLAAKSDEEFESAYANLIAVEERNGYTDECLKEMNQLYEKIVGESLNELKNWKSE